METVEVGKIRRSKHSQFVDSRPPQAESLISCQPHAPMAALTASSRSVSKRASAKG